jgi:hypothetical protein
MKPGISSHNGTLGHHTILVIEGHHTILVFEGHNTVRFYFDVQVALQDVLSKSDNQDKPDHAAHTIGEFELKPRKKTMRLIGSTGANGAHTTYPLYQKLTREQ